MPIHDHSLPRRERLQWGAGKVVLLALGICVASRPVLAQHVADANDMRRAEASAASSAPRRPSRSNPRWERAGRLADFVGLRVVVRAEPGVEVRGVVWAIEPTVCTLVDNHGTPSTIDRSRVSAVRLVDPPGEGRGTGMLVAGGILLAGGAASLGPGIGDTASVDADIGIPTLLVGAAAIGAGVALLVHGDRRHASARRRALITSGAAALGDAPRLIRGDGLGLRIAGAVLLGVGLPMAITAVALKVDSVGGEEEERFSAQYDALLGTGIVMQAGGAALISVGLTRKHRLEGTRRSPRLRSGIGAVRVDF